MASALATQKLFSRQKIVGYINTGAAAATLKGMQDLRDFDKFAVLATVAALTGSGLTKLEIIAAENLAGTTNATVIKDSGALVADAVADQAALECTAEEIAQLGRASGYALRYVGARVTMNNNADVVAVTTIAAGAKNEHLDLTPATTIA
jgi:hypothetical protein